MDDAHEWGVTFQHFLNVWVGNIFLGIISNASFAVVFAIIGIFWKNIRFDITTMLVWLILLIGVGETLKSLNIFVQSCIQRVHMPTGKLLTIISIAVYCIVLPALTFLVIGNTVGGRMACVLFLVGHIVVEIWLYSAKPKVVPARSFDEAVSEQLKKNRNSGA